MTTKKPLVGIYYRVSTEVQDLEIQKKNLPKYAKERGWKTFDTYEDDGISGSSIDARPGFKKLLEDLQNNKFEILLVNEISRISRADSPAERGYLIELLMKHKITLAASTEPDIDPNTPMGEKYLQDTLWMAKQERRGIAKRMTDGRRRAMEKGIPMYSKKLHGRRIIVNKETGEITWKVDEAKINKIRRAGKLMLEKRCGWRTAANEVGIRWNLLRHTILTSGGSTFKQKNVSKTLGVDETYEFEIPKHARIFDDLTLRRILQVVKDNTTSHGPIPKEKNLLTRVLRDRSGQALYGIKKTNGTKYYHRPGKGKKFHYYVRAEVLDRAVMEAIAHALSFPERFKTAVYNGKDKADRRKELQKEIVNLSLELDQNQQKIDRIIDGIADGTIYRSEANRKLTELRESKEKIKKALQTRKVEIVSIPTPEKIESVRRALLNDIRKYTPDGKPIPIPDLS